MKLHVKYLIPFFLFFSYSIFSQGTSIYSKSAGDWNDVNTWSTGTIPTINDDVFIDGYKVSISSGNFMVNSLTVTNISEASDTEIEMEGSAKLTVINDCFVDAPEHDSKVMVHLLSNSFLEILGQIIFTRGVTNNTDKMLQLFMEGSAKLKVHGNFSYNYSNASINEPQKEINLKNTSQLEVLGNMIINVSGGEGFEMNTQNFSSTIIGGDFIVNASGGNEVFVNFHDNTTVDFAGNFKINNSGTSNVIAEFGSTNASIKIDGDVSIISTSPNKDILVDVFGGTIISLGRDIFMRAVGDNDVEFMIEGVSEVYLAGNIDRTDFGTFLMSTDSRLILNGSTPQNIPTQDQFGSGTDEFFITNILINNTSGQPLPLAGPMTIQKNLDLSNGIIKTTDTNILTIKDGATITGASSTAFIDGPIIKQGTSGGTPFVFPTGKGSTFAPIAVSALSNPNSEFKAEFFGDPPPWGTNFTGGINNINGNGFWNLSKTAVSEKVNVILSWNNATGITDLNSLLVARLNETNQEWEDFGNSGTTGNTTSGTVTSSSLMGDPPPWGTEIFTLASRSPLNSLPVELTKFQAVQQSEIVHLQWETASELNTREFIIEYSRDGVNFESIGTEFSDGNSNVTKTYTHQHRNPIEGISYYRLKIVDFDNSFEYSHIEVVKFDQETKLNIFPNPVTKFLHIHGDFSDHEDVMIEIYDREGREIYVGSISFDAGRFMMDTESLNINQPGTYFLRITNRADSFVQKFIKAK